MSETTTAAAPVARQPEPHGQLEWSAFGATYPDTQCVNGLLLDLDSLLEPELVCPLCQPVQFFHDWWADGDAEPRCATCLAVLPPEALTFHDGKGLTWTVDCPTCGPNQPGLIRSTETDQTDEDEGR